MPQPSPRPLPSGCPCHTGSRSERSHESMAQGLPSPRRGCLFWAWCSNTFPSMTPRKVLRSSPGLSVSTSPLATPRDPGHRPHKQPGATRHHWAGPSPVPGHTSTREIGLRGRSLTPDSGARAGPHSRTSVAALTIVRNPAECTGPERTELGGGHRGPVPSSEEEGSGHSGCAQAGLTPRPRPVGTGPTAAGACGTKQSPCGRHLPLIAHLPLLWGPRAQPASSGEWKGPAK